MRGPLPGVPSAAPVMDRLPAVYQDDDFLRRFTAAIDDALAPVFVTVDNVAAYVDPELTPADFLDWLFGWVALFPADRWSEEQRRAIVANAVSLHRHRGTVHGVAESVRLAIGGDVDVIESGGSAFSAHPGAPMPGAAPATLHVRVRTPASRPVSVRWVDAVVTLVKPAHVAHTVEVLEVPDADLP